jgi:hypothetical protein
MTHTFNRHNRRLSRAGSLWQGVPNLFTEGDSLMRMFLAPLAALSFSLAATHTAMAEEIKWVSTKPATEADVALIDLGVQDDFEMVIEINAPGRTAGIFFRAHENKDFEPSADGGDLGVEGIYGNSLLSKPDGSVEFTQSNGTTKTNSSVLNSSTSPATVRISAKGDTIEVSRDGASLTLTRRGDWFLSGSLYFVALPGDADAPPAEVTIKEFKDLDREENWQPLFNGENFDGWKQWGSEQWDIEDGMIIGRSGPKKSEGYLATEKTWTDFRVRGAFKMLGEGNFGLFYHSTITIREKDDYPVIAGVQGEVEPAYPSSTGWLYESYKRGWLVEPPKNTLAAYVLKPTEWNTIEIRSEGEVVTTWVNGVQALKFDDPDRQLTEGSFALQLHAGGVDGIAWKDLYVVE